MTRRAVAAALMAALMAAGGQASGGRQAAAAGPQEMVSVIVTLHEQANLRAIRTKSPAARSRAVISSLKQTAERSQKRLAALLSARRGEIAKLTLYWVFNGFALTATPALVAELAAQPEVASVTPEETVLAPPPPATSSSPPEWNVGLVNAPALWALGHTGQGVVVANMDTGVDGTHPDLAPRFRGGTNSWFDPYGQHPSEPTDVNGHGTWTMGVMVAGDAGGTAVGIAPDAQWIAVKIFNDAGAASTSAIHAGFQWLLDPDGNAATDDAPDVVSNSWTLSAPGCSLEFAQDIESLRAAGILPVFAAGNFGPGGSTSASPGNNPGALAVGATDDQDAISSESSRGPSACGEPEATFPELTAPGVDIWTTDLFGLYYSATGTSLAAPHAAGALALLLDAFPGLPVEEQESALENGAVDLGAAGPDDTFGHGRLDVQGAYSWVSLVPDFTLTAAPASASTTRGGSVSYTITVEPVNGFSGSVSLDVSGLGPLRASPSFLPATIDGGSGSSQLTVAVATWIPLGSYPLTITARSGNLTHTATVTLVVGSFALSATPSHASTIPGGQATYTVTVVPIAGFFGPVSLSLDDNSAVQGWDFQPQTIADGAGSSQLTVTALSTLRARNYPLVISATSGGMTRKSTVTLRIGDFKIAIGPSTRSVRSGGTAYYSVNVHSLNGFTGTMALAVDGLPPGASATLTPSSAAAPRHSILAVTTAAGSPPGTFTLTVTGQSGALARQGTTTLNIV